MAAGKYQASFPFLSVTDGGTYAALPNDEYVPVGSPSDDETSGSHARHTTNGNAGASGFAGFDDDADGACEIACHGSCFASFNGAL